LLFVLGGHKWQVFTKQGFLKDDILACVET